MLRLLRGRPEISFFAVGRKFCALVSVRIDLSTRNLSTGTHLTPTHFLPIKAFLFTLGFMDFS